jgi:glycosyltransferase involved in cell wall biosynthesis
MISVIMATFNRSEIIGFAIRSVQKQTCADWELLVVGDGCTDDTETIVSSFQDPRIQFFNLAQRVGDQSGPTNFGIQQAKGEFLAFLNHDDFWFPDHLERSIDHLKNNHCDLVYTLQIDVDPGNPSLRVPSIYLENFTPFLPPNISTWTCYRNWAVDQLPMKPFYELFTYPSIDWLLSALKRGARYQPVPAVTVFVITTISRQKTYSDKISEEHAFWFQQIFEGHKSREQMLVEAFQNPKPTHLQGYSLKWLLRAVILRLLKRTLQYLHCSPIAFVVYLRCPKKWGIFPAKGALRKKLYSKRGLNLENLCQ